MPSRINIHFDGNEQNVYYSGETVSGTVEIEFQKVKKVRGISFQIIGFARTHWDGSSFLTQYTYIGKENYLTSRKYLIGSDLDSARDIEPGIYSYNFSCTLPKQLPSSFEGKFGCIRYIAKVTLERPWKFDQTYTVGFTVLRPVDLNLESPLIRVPSEVEVFHQFWCSPCLSKPIHIKGKLPQTGYVPGQTISLLAEVNNASNVDAKEVNIRFQCVISYQADSPRLKCRQDILDLACIKCDPIPKKSSGCFVEKIVIPPVPSSSNSNYSKMIQLSYCVRIEAVTSHFHNNAYVLCPITIGTVPFIPLRQQIIENAEIIRRTRHEFGLLERDYRK